MKYYGEAKYFFAVQEQLDVLNNSSQLCYYSESAAESVSATYQVFTLTL